MSDVGDLKVWFREDIAGILMGVNAASPAARSAYAGEDAYREGFLAALVSIALIVGVQPEGFLLPDDVALLRHSSHSRLHTSS